MKKLFKLIRTIFTKSDKLGDLLIEIQRGLTVCKKCLEAVGDGVKPDAKVHKTLNRLLKYVDTASDAVSTILEWLGRDDEICMAEPKSAKADKELAQITDNIRALLK